MKWQTIVGLATASVLCIGNAGCNTTLISAADATYRATLLGFVKIKGHNNTITAQRDSNIKRLWIQGDGNWILVEPGAALDEVRFSGMKNVVLISADKWYWSMSPNIRRLYTSQFGRVNISVYEGIALGPTYGTAVDKQLSGENQIVLRYARREPDSAFAVPLAIIRLAEQATFLSRDNIEANRGVVARMFGSLRLLEQWGPKLEAYETYCEQTVLTSNDPSRLSQMFDDLELAAGNTHSTVNIVTTPPGATIKYAKPPDFRAGRMSQLRMPTLITTELERAQYIFQAWRAGVMKAQTGVIDCTDHSNVVKTVEIVEDRD